MIHTSNEMLSMWLSVYNNDQTLERQNNLKFMESIADANPIKRIQTVGKAVAWFLGFKKKMFSTKLSEHLETSIVQVFVDS